MDAYAELQTKAKDMPVADLKVDFGRVAMTRLGNKAVILNNITHSTPTGRMLLKDFSFEFLPGKRIGVAGELVAMLYNLYYMKYAIYEIIIYILYHTYSRVYTIC